jgi:hypothetical protein
MQSQSAPDNVQFVQRSRMKREMKNCVSDSIVQFVLPARPFTAGVAILLLIGVRLPVEAQQSNHNRHFNWSDLSNAQRMAHYSHASIRRK